MASICIDRVVKKFADQTVLQDLSLNIPDGAFYTLLGPSGCGKTTLLRCIAGFNEPDGGRILFDQDEHPLLQAAGEVGNGSRWFGLAGVSVPHQLPGPVFDRHFLCLQAAVNELGLALAPWCLLEEDLTAGRLRPLFTEPLMVGPGVYAMYRTDSPAADARRANPHRGSQGSWPALHLDQRGLCLFCRTFAAAAWSG